MWVVGAITATRATRRSESIRWATWRPNVVLPAAGVAEARNESARWENTASAARRCHARSDRPAGHEGIRRFIGRRRLPNGRDGTADARRGLTVRGGSRA